MANKNSRLPQNVPGSWYVDSNCIDCDLCRETAPNVFRRDEDNCSSYVFHQPVSEDELQLAEEAMSGCPVEAIGNDDAPPQPSTSSAAVQSVDQQSDTFPVHTADDWT